MKTNKSLLVKLLTLVCALCCCLSLVFGLAACSDSESIKGIKSTTINQYGEFVVIYTDGSTDNLGVITQTGEYKNILAEKCIDGAAHTLHTETVKYANCVEEGIEFAICTTCKGYEVKSTEKDDTAHYSITKELRIMGNQAVEVLIYTDFATEAGDHKDATCFEAGYAHIECSKCSALIEEGVIPAINHGVSASNPYGDYVAFNGVQKDQNLCIDGAVDGYICPHCYTVYENEEDLTDPRNPEYIPARGYHYAESDWTYVSKPTLTTAGSITGVCQNCKTTQTVEVPALTSNIYTKSTVTPATCAQNGKDNYTGMVDGFTVDIDVETSTKHTFNGREIDLDKKYSAEEVTFYGLTIISNVDNNCLVDGEAIFKCDDCGKTLKVVISGAHKSSATEPVRVVAPTCQAEGYDVYVCDVCNEEYKVNFTSKIACQYEEDATRRVTNPDGTLNLVFVCKMCKDELALDNVTKNVAESYAATCKAPGKDVYDYDDPVAGTGKVEITLAQLTEHKFADGVYFKGADVNAEGYAYSQVAAYVGNGLDIIANVPSTCIGKGEAVFKCADCQATIKIYVYADHNIEGQELKTVEAKCGVDGYTYKVCKVCEEEIKISDIPALTHEYKEDESKRVANPDGTYNLTFVCSKCGDEVAVANATKTGTVPATCKAAGKDIYSFVGPNGADTFEIVIPALTDHAIVAGTTLKGADVFAEGYTYSAIADYITAGSLEFISNVPVSCTEKGEAVFKCLDCGKTIKIHVYADHKLGAFTTIPSDCDEDGYRYQECSVCNEKFLDESYVDLKDGHKYGNQEPVLVGDQLKFVCTVCGEEDLVTPDKIDVVGADCTTKGLKIYWYDNETKSITVETPALGHDYLDQLIEFDIVINGVVHTCQGYICTECGEVLIVSIVPPIE